LAKNIPPASIWAYDPNGINQVGCIYTAQGFEFDYIGVIVGKDFGLPFQYRLVRQSGSIFRYKTLTEFC
jgi:DUF2075 family protein